MPKLNFLLGKLGAKVSNDVYVDHPEPLAFEVHFILALFQDTVFDIFSVKTKSSNFYYETFWRDFY